MSNKQKTFAAVLGIATAAAFGIVVDASAATKKLSYEQAWAHCKALLDAEKAPGDLVGHARTFRGRACMEKYGYKI